MNLPVKVHFESTVTLSCFLGILFLCENTELNSLKMTFWGSYYYLIVLTKNVLVLPDLLRSRQMFAFETA
jgi:hypothetical protein